MSNINLFNEDCMEVMQRYPDKYFDLAIVDPPYGINIGKMSYVKSGAVKTGAGRRTDFSKSSTQWDEAVPTSEYFKELRRVSKNQIIWGGNYFVSELGNTSCFLVWDKENGTTDFADCELAWTSFSSPVRKFSFMWNGMLQGNMKNKEQRIHPTQKPATLYKWILKQYATPDMKILDTHGGSMSSVIAFHDFRIQEAVVCEIDTEYFQKGKARYEQHKRQLNLFAA